MSAISALLDLITSEQQPDGSFVATSSMHADGSEPRFRYRTTFLTSQIVAAIAGAKGAEHICEKACAFLRTQFRDGSVNYWARDSQESKDMPLPDDLDDTACALIALVLCDPSIKHDGELLGAFTRVLIETESAPGGPYQTWRIGNHPDPRWKDVDVAVNANVAYALQLLDVKLAALDRFLDEAVATKQFRSPYYPDESSPRYFFSRIRPEIPRPILNGRAFCLDPAVQGTKYYSGSVALEAAFRVQEMRQVDAIEVTASIPDEKSFEWHQRIMRGAHAALPEDKALHLACAKLLDRIEGFDAGKQITLTPWRFAQALGLLVDPDLLERLGRVNVFGWAAYTAYDDVLDGDAGGELIPPANVFLRLLQAELQQVHATHPGFQTWWRSVLDRVDAANLWELDHMRLAQPPRIDDPLFLAERSLGHVIGPIAIMLSHGFAFDSTETRAVFEMYRCYLAARQMHDDAHDWQADYSRGQFNSASIFLKIGGDMEALRTDFWTRVIVDHSKTILDVCARGHAAIDLCKVLKYPEGLHAMLAKIEQGTHEALNGREKTMAFLKTFIK